MNKRLFKYLFFILLVVVVDQVTGIFISNNAKKYARDNRLEMLINNQIPSDLYIIGSSRALNNYDPKTISINTGIKSYNLGVSGSNIVFHELVLDLVLSLKNKPKYIIYNVDDYGTLFNMEGIIFRKDVIAPFVDNHFVNRTYCEQTGRNWYATLIMSSYRQNINFFNAVKYLVNGREAIDYKTTNFDSNGANLLIQRDQDPVPVYGRKRAASVPDTMDQVHVESFKRIQQKCLEQGIHLIICLPPLYTEKSPGFKQHISERILEGVRLLDFTDQLQSSEYFFNNDHMNYTGAVKFSEILAKEINKITN